VYIDSAGEGNRRLPSDAARLNNLYPVDQLTDMQRLAQASTGEMLPIFGRDFFQRVPSTFAPADQIPELTDYIVGPGDQILVRLWGPTSFNGQLTVDSSGSIYVPQVGAIHVAGLRVDELQNHISSDIQQTFRNFNLSVNLGHLRSIQVYVVGEARRPGAYTVSSLSTVLNVLFVSGGPNVQGSLRQIQVRRAGKTVATLDLYDLLLRGDKTQDIRLQPDDTIFIPAAGPQAALAGSVRHPAVYELHGETTVDALLQLAGGFTPTASTTQISIERVEENRARAAMTVNLDAAGRAVVLHDGDVLFANHITAAYQQSVTIRGNLANPGRFPWQAGMRLSDIIPDRMSLLTTNYWRQRNKLGVPEPLFEPLRPMQRTTLSNRFPQSLQGRTGLQTQIPGNSNQNSDSSDGQNGDQNGLQTPYNSADVPLAIVNGQYSTTLGNLDSLNQRTPDDPGADGTLNNNSGTNSTSGDRTTLSQGSLAEGQQSGISRTLASVGQQNNIRIPAPEIDWSYSVIERLDPNTLKSSLVPFSLQKLLQDHDPSQNLELQPGDIVTILSQGDIRVPQDERTKYVRLEGEFLGAGVYSAGPNETLNDLVRRAGGLTGKAYLYGASFTRESARVFQQQRLDEYINTVSINLQRAAAVRSASSSTGVSDPNIILEQREITDQLRKLRATGRIVLEFKPDSAGLDSVPNIPLEDGDIFRVPSRPLTVNVIGAVYGQNVFLYNPNRRVEDYLLLAGKPNPVADRKHAFIIRADGSVFSRSRAQGPWKNSFDVTTINPGDSIVVPEQPVKPSFVRQFIDYSQIFSQFALGAAAITVIKQ
jgi:protein involved in polysaccharide export with SLBB domain